MWSLSLFFSIHVGEGSTQSNWRMYIWITMSQEVQFTERHLFAYNTVFLAQLVDTPTQFLGESIQPSSNPQSWLIFASIFQDLMRYLPSLDVPPQRHEESTHQWLCQHNTFTVYLSTTFCYMYIQYSLLWASVKHSLRWAGVKHHSLKCIGRRYRPVTEL